MCVCIYVYIKGELILFKLCKILANKVTGVLRKSKLINVCD